MRKLSTIVQTKKFKITVKKWLANNPSRRQYMAAKMAGITPQRLGAILRSDNTSRVNIDVILRFAKRANIDPGRILGSDDQQGEKSIYGIKETAREFIASRGTSLSRKKAHLLAFQLQELVWQYLGRLVQTVVAMDPEGNPSWVTVIVAPKHNLGTANPPKLQVSLKPNPKDPRSGDSLPFSVMLSSGRVSTTGTLNAINLKRVLSSI